MIALAKKLRRCPVHGRRRSLTDIADALPEACYLSSAGTRFTGTAISRILDRKQG
jgi:hypothetical protein